MSQETTAETNDTDWAGLVLAALMLGWVAGISVVGYSVAWFAEQIAIATGFEPPMAAWPLVAVGHVVLVGFPVWFIAWLWRTPRYQGVFRLWAITAVLLLFLLPVRFVPANAAQTANLWQLIGLALFLAFLKWYLPSSLFPPPSSLLSLLPPLLLAPLLLYGWLAWGALGSIMDVLLSGLVALLFGAVMGVMSEQVLIRPLSQTTSGSGWDITLGGFAIGGALVIACAGLGWNGQQLLLMAALPATAWVVMGLHHWQPGWVAPASFIALVTSAVLLFVDPDELSLILNLGSRDILTWAGYATLAMVGVGWLVGMGLFLLRDYLPQNRPFLLIGTAVTWLIGMALYLFVGQPGFYGERLFVIFKDQADVSSAVSMPDYWQRREFVYNTLVNHADTTQADIRNTLDTVGISYTPYYLVNAIEVEAGPIVRLWLTTRPEVDRILEDVVLRPLPAPVPTATGEANAPSEPQWNLTLIGADRVWSEFGITGEGIVVGQSDSGVQGDHPELAPTYRGQDGSHNYNWYDPWNHTTQPTDIGGHGTHTLGSIVGQTVGVAPGASWYGCVNLARNLGNPALYLDCLQFMLAPFPLDGNPLADGDPTLGAHVLNNSWGCPDLEGCDPNALLPAVQALRAAGVFVVASAGNDGLIGCETVADPIALYDEVFSVGAMDVNGVVADFSSRGPVTADSSSRIKPDILAPGVNVLSSMPGNTYEYNDGTSMAGPHVAGVVALIWSANPTLIGDIDRTEQILIETAQPYDYGTGIPTCADPEDSPNNAVGHGVVDAFSAVQMALGNNP